tara:strand:+ start:214 stop:966 length:753 start_codon:yes stop_codon:yes gene_type:complete
VSKKNNKTENENKIKEEIKQVVKKKKRKVYFGMEVQDAIVRYNDSNNDVERNQIYQTEIHAAFDKLCENIINTFKFEYFDDVYIDVKQEVLSFLVMNMHKYDHTKGSKAFSYFSVVAKNYLILHNNANYKKYKAHVDVDILNSKRVGGSKSEYFVDFVDEMVIYLEDNIPSLFKNKKDLDVAYALIELMRRRDEIENFNKKALYVLIREMTDIETSHITKVVNVLKKEYKKLIKQFETRGIIENKKNKFF